MHLGREAFANRTLGSRYRVDSQAELTPARLLWEQGAWISQADKNGIVPIHED
jgi:hypothetical protein